MKKIISPSSILIEETAARLATEFYEIGRGQGLTSKKHKTARHYAAANLEHFVPHAIDMLKKILCNNSAPVEMRDMILAAFQERISDPEAVALAEAAGDYQLPNIDIAKLIPVQDLPSVIVDQRKTRH